MPKKKKGAPLSRRKYHYNSPTSKDDHISNEQTYNGDGTKPHSQTHKFDHNYSSLQLDQQICTETGLSQQLMITDLSANDENQCVIMERQEEVSTTLMPFQQLQKDVNDRKWDPFQVLISDTAITFMDMYNVDFPSVKLSFKISNNFSLKIYVHNKPLPDNHEIWNSVPKVIQCVDKLSVLLQILQKYEVCTGNVDEDFHEITPVGSAITHTKSMEIAAYREADMGASYENTRYTSTIRSISCKLLCLKSSNQRCKPCCILRGSLRSIKSRRDQKSSLSTPSSFLTSRKPLSAMSKLELKQKCQGYKLQSNRLKLHIEKLKSKFRSEITQEGEELSEKDSTDLSNLVDECDQEIKQAYPDESCFQRLFWEEQKKYNQLKDKRQMKWHPMIIKWCLFLRHKSATTYSALRDIGFVNLPSSRTLYDYSHYVKNGCRFEAEVTEQFMKEMEDKKLNEEWQKYVGILFDEMRIKSDLVYNKHTGELVGFLNLNDIGNAILDMERHMQDQRQPKLAKYVLVIYVRGIATNLAFPFAHFATGGITADVLYPIIWEAVEILEVTVGLKVLFVTCDGASPNRRFFRLHHPPVNIHDATVYCTENPYAVSEKRYLHFISDVPHLLKTARNCFANSHSHKKSRKLWFEKDITWMHIVDLYEECLQGVYNFCPKLTRAHIDLTSFGCMKVRLAAQVMSDTVAFALCQTRGDNVSGTVKFIRNMNKFFDCLNTRSLYEGRFKRNPNLNPYTDINDDRLRWLVEDFLTYFSLWKTAVENRPGDYTKKQRAAMMLSYQTLEGLEITVKSIVACIKYMLRLGAPFILSEAFNQDILEQHFGHHRGRCGSNTNPTLAEFDNNMTNLRVIGSHAVASAHGNTTRRLDNRNIDNTPLPKRKRPRI